MYTTKKDDNKRYTEIVVNNKVFYKFLGSKECSSECTNDCSKEQNASNETKVDDTTNASNKNSNKENLSNKEKSCTENVSCDAIQANIESCKVKDEKIELFTKQESEGNKIINEMINKMLENKNVQREQEIKNENKRKIEQPRRKRYSDRFKDPMYIKKEMYRKAKLLENFYKNKQDIDEEIVKYSDCIALMIDVLQNEYQIPVKELFRRYKLEEYGFALKDYCDDEEESQ